MSRQLAGDLRLTAPGREMLVRFCRARFCAALEVAEEKRTRAHCPPFPARLVLEEGGGGRGERGGAGDVHLASPPKCHLPQNSLPSPAAATPRICFHWTNTGGCHPFQVALPPVSPRLHTHPPLSEPFVSSVEKGSESLHGIPTPLGLGEGSVSLVHPGGG